MSNIPLHGTKLFGYSSNHLEFPRTAASASWTMNAEPKSVPVNETEDLRLRIPLSPAPLLNNSSRLRFDQLKPLEKDLVQQNRHEFGRFVAREAVLDEEYWAAAWLRAESHWDDRPNERYAESYKRKFAEQEFSAIKRRCRVQNGQKSSCIVTVKKDQSNEQCTVLKSVIATLDLSIRFLLHGETFPGEKVRAPVFCLISKTGPSRYGYITNLCVAKSARRQGIATNMLTFCIETARTAGIDVVYVHVYRDNKAAQRMYEKMGFRVVDEATPQLKEEQTYLLSLGT